jgi:hypothetical protein
MKTDFSSCFSLYLGKSANDSDVLGFLQAIGCKKTPKAKWNEPYFYFTSTKDGVGVTFYDEDYLREREVEYYGQAPMILKAITLEPTDSANHYPNSIIQLPDGVRFGVSRGNLLDVLGASSKTFESGGKIRSDRWMYEGGRMIASYDQLLNLKRIQLITAAFD